MIKKSTLLLYGKDAESPLRLETLISDQTDETNQKVKDFQTKEETIKY